MSKRFNFLALILAFIFVNAVLILPVFASETDGTIDATHRYAWGENIGWIDFSSSYGNVHVFDSELTGYVWAENVGWISLNCSNTNSCEDISYKVSNNSEGNLSGFGWGENVGWIDFSNVSIDTTGIFTGYAWGENIGWISLNCENTNSCETVDYKAATDWRPQSARSAVNISVDDFSQLLELKYIESDQDITNTVEVTFKVETRTNVFTNKGEVEIVVPDQTVVTLSDGGTMDFTKLTTKDSSDEASDVEDQDVVSAIQYGIPEVSLLFSKPITITIPVDSSYNGETLNVYKSSSATSGWKFLTTCEVFESKCTFNTTTASYFSATKRRGGGGLPAGAYSPPVAPLTGFSVLINNGDEISNSRRVTLTFNAGSDVTSITISNYSDFNDAILQEHTSIKAWDLCSETGGLIIFPECPERAYTVYAKFYTKWGRASEAVFDSIAYKLPVPVEIEELVPVEAKEEVIPVEEAVEAEEETLLIEDIAQAPVVSAPEELPIAIAPSIVIPSEPPVSEESQIVLPHVISRIEEGPEQEALLALYERTEIAPNVLVAAIANVRLMYGGITQSFLFTTAYVLLLLSLLSMLGKEVKRWHI